MTGKWLKTIPAQLVSLTNYKKRAPGGDVLVPNDPGMRRYGANPYAGYDTSPTPFLFQGDLPKGINPMVRVIVVDGQARDVVYDVTFAFVYNAFFPGRKIYVN